MSGKKPDGTDPFDLIEEDASENLANSAAFGSGRSSMPPENALYPNDTPAKALERKKQQLKCDLEYMEEQERNERMWRIETGKKRTVSPETRVIYTSDLHGDNPNQWFVDIDPSMIDCPDGKLPENYTLRNYEALPSMASDDLARVISFFEESLDPGMKPH